MDDLSTKTANKQEKLFFPAGSNFVFNKDADSRVVFAREVCRRNEVTKTGVGASKHTMDVNSGCQHRNVTVENTPLLITQSPLLTQPTEPQEKPPKRDKADTESRNSPVIDKSLIDSSDVAKTTLLQSYRISSGVIARPVHGLQHSCRTAIWALSILQLRKQQHAPRALAFPDHMVPLLIKACLFHDSGRDDTAEWKQASADNLREHLRNCGVEQSLAWQCGEAICNKDHPDACQRLPEAIQTLRSLLHDADKLDDIRVRRCFYMDRLECFAACQDDNCRESWRLLATEICKVIAHQGDLRAPIALHNSEASDEQFFSIDTASWCEDTKKQWEHHPAPLWHQLFTIGEQSDFIRGLITPYTEEYLAEPPESTFSLAQLSLHSKDTKECQSSWQKGLYRDPVNQQFYAIKETSCELSARNQVLMANLARLLGITVPESFVHQEQGRFYVINHIASEWPGNLKGGQEVLQSLSSEQWARLMLVNVIVGNESMVNSAWEGIELTPEGEPVMFHWDYAGLATRYLSPDEPGTRKPAPGTDNFSSMPVLLKKLRDPRAPVMNSFPIKNPCGDILSRLSDDFLGQALRKILRQVDWQALDRLIEHSGFLPGDRSWLRQTIHDRIAWLTTRLPNSLEEAERVSMAEYKAIEAAGIRGGWLPVKGQDIRDGQVCISQLLDANDQPITRMTLRLSRSAGNRLADNLALERGLHHLASKAGHISDNLHDQFRDWRSDLTSLTDECDAMAKQLANDIDRWHPEDYNTINRTVVTLQDIVKKCQASADQPSIEPLPEIHRLPAPVFPARVSSRVTAEAEATVQLAQFSHGFARLTGENVNYFTRNQLDDARVAVSPIRRIELKADVEGGSIEFFPPNLPNALTFEHKLTITLPGHSKAVVEALFEELGGLGIHGERPNTQDLEERWLDALADYHGCLGDMNRVAAADDSTPVNTSKKKFLNQLLQPSDDTMLDWEVHCRIRAGRLVYYRPGLPHGIMTNPARGFCFGHNINYFPDRQRDIEQVVIDSLKNEGALTSFGRRTDIGMQPFGNARHMVKRVKYDTNYVFSQLRPVNPTDEQEEMFRKKCEEVISMVFKPETIGRLDGTVFASLDHLTPPYPELDARTRTLRIIARSTDDYQRVVQGGMEQETRFSNPLSLPDELERIKFSSLEDQFHMLHTLQQRYSHWPDGRALEQLCQKT